MIGIRMRSKCCEPTTEEIEFWTSEALNGSKSCNKYKLVRLDYFYNRKAKKYFVCTTVNDGRHSVSSTFSGKYPYGAVTDCVFGIVPSIIESEINSKQL